MSAGQPVFRTATADEVALTLDWAAAEGWNPGLEDAGAFRAADPKGFFVADVNGQPVAAISVVNHGPGHAFLGLYLCLEAYRGRGIGFDLWTYALGHADLRAVGLDGVAAQEANYARSGFVRTGATTRWEGQLDAATDPRVRLAGPLDAVHIAAMDTAAGGYARPAFLAAWTAQTDTRRTLVLEDGTPKGFATIRLCREGAKIGPVVAPDAAMALVLARAALAELPAGHVVLDLPSANATLTAELTARGFYSNYAAARMWRGTAPRATPELQAIATMELG